MFKKRWLLVLVALTLLLIVVPACGDDDGEEPTATTIATVTSEVTKTNTPTVTSTPTPSSTTPTTSGEPVKIGAITAWSGPAANSGLSYADPIIKLVEWQVKQEGGILGGREVKIVRYDNRASVAEAAAGARKLMVDDKVSALSLGGVSGAESAAISEFAEENHILYCLFGAMEVEDPQYTISATVSYNELMGEIRDLALKVLHPKKVAVIAVDLADGRQRVPILKNMLEPSGIDFVYEEYVSIDTMADVSAQVTKIRSKDPDLLYIDAGTSEFFLNTMMAFRAQGGWGDMEVVGLAQVEQAKTRPDADGVYVSTLWVPGVEEPGSVKFETEYGQVNDGKTPNPAAVYYYNAFWNCIKAIDLAGTDTDLEKIAWTARFSGQLEWESPMGHCHFTEESGGYGGLQAHMTQIVDKQLVLVDIPE